MAIARIILQDTDKGVNITQVYEPPPEEGTTSEAQEMGRQMVAALLSAELPEEVSEEKPLVV
tara:strand:- start:280 stop:465 length:186 start_codon:yes stop_codon:yes gene_type:complete